jgi:ornithine--oxo-acid transaminase
MRTVPFNDIEALAEAVTPNTVAFLVEPIQGEAGIVMPAPDYLKRVRELCDEHRILLICDEVQTGFCRTGALFCHQHSGIKPDLLTLGKALGGGVYPVSAVVGTNEVMDLLRPGDHGSTFGGNAIAAAVSVTAMNLLGDPALCERVHALGERAMKKLRKALAGNTVVRDVRGQGLFIGVEVDAKVGARAIVERLKERGVLTKDTHDVVIRLAPPLTISARDLNRALDTLVAVLAEAAAAKM